MSTHCTLIHVDDDHCTYKLYTECFEPGFVYIEVWYKCCQHTNIIKLPISVWREMSSADTNMKIEEHTKAAEDFAKPRKMDKKKSRKNLKENK